jgi:hypothetical protein
MKEFIKSKPSKDNYLSKRDAKLKWKDEDLKQKDMEILGLKFKRKENEELLK